MSTPLSSRPVFRFAPSPNGRLHLGHAFSALFTERAARAAAGTLMLRIEDIDRVRCKPEFDAAIIEDLHWLGLDWPEPVMRQSSRFPAYADAADQLRAAGVLYPCFCTRSEIAAAATGRDPDGGPLYPGTCRHLSAHEVAARLAPGEAAQWRLRTDEALAMVGPLVICEHAVEGVEVLPSSTTRPAHPERWGDIVIVRRDTPTSYHLSVVVDDAAQGVTTVTRGLDLFAATDIHVLLQKLLGLPSPTYAHHGLITDEAEQKLSKSKGSPSLASLRDAGWTSEDVRRRLGFG